MNVSQRVVTADGAGRIRTATFADLRGLMRLARSASSHFLSLGLADLSELLDRGQLLVLDLGAEDLGAAVYVRNDARADDADARLTFLVISPALVGRGVEDRMTAAVLALSESCDIER